MNSELCFNCERNFSSASTCVVKIFRTSFRLLISSTEILKRNSCVLPGRMKTIIFLTNMVKDNLTYMKKFWKILIHAPRNGDSNSTHGNNKLPLSIQNQAILDFSFVSINNSTEKITLSKYFTLSLLGCTDKNIVHHLLFPKIIKVSLWMPLI